MTAPATSVILCTHNPARDRLHRTLVALRGQTLPSDRWEVLVVDNASAPALTMAELVELQGFNLRLIQEPVPGLTSARRAGLHAARGDFIVFVDDDNVLAPDYLAKTLAAFDRLPRVGALGGKSLPEFASPLSPEDWRREFFPLLALRDLGDTELISSGLRPPGAVRDEYPAFAPIGAGMALRREAAHHWLASGNSGLSDRRGGSLSSAGDNDIVFAAMHAGWEVAYVPALQLTHLIPSSRLEPAYLGRLNRGIQESWIQLLQLHEAAPWPALSPLSAHLRKLKAWFTYRVWSGAPAARIRWLGACGHFDGRASPPNLP